MLDLAIARQEYLRAVACTALARRSGTPHLNIVDTDQEECCAIGAALAPLLPTEICQGSPTPQAVGTRFTVATSEFLARVLSALPHVRPGTWRILHKGMPAGIMDFDQYAHLAEIARLVREHASLRTALGCDYLVKPDIIVARAAWTDADLNRGELRVSEDVATYSPLRAANAAGSGTLHASVSCKWTIRSDRAQNVRTEALNLLRNRKGRAPHMVAVTFEPLPSRLASLGRGTGDLDCVYHAALYELQEAVEAAGSIVSRNVLAELVDGRRLRDISDLPLDLAM